MASPVNFESFYIRAYRCYFYRETDTYIKNTRILFERVLKKYSLNTNTSLLKLYIKEFNRRSYGGTVGYVYKEDRELFKEYSSKCISNLIKLFETEVVTNIMDSYEYKYMIKGFIHGMIESKSLNLYLSFTNLIETEKLLDIASFNSYIYNAVHGTSNSCLVMSVPLNTFYVLPYTNNDYPIGHGYIRRNLTNKLRRRGTHCRTCKNDCKPLLVNGLDRLTALL